ncbi:O-Antigen ligase [Dethiosulfatibacter aminovorans DSM 17477]|uniref:O-Antigen ligase n=1 Tax=Dethiosulfatibacter aminovorans DSM 17477 TaxID=1121476 RepID=A0A1M6KPQ7_9FIRM|nr:O-antigen ligase family protein [Dethiosulfatibacter aminovorans]SHJ60881.1 O-Antigen ligase [Dethiosulfatibacter aminovorans DSM 17477]
MAKKKKDNIRRKTKEKADLGWYYLIPLIFIVAIVPLITYCKVMEIEGAEMLTWKGGNTNIDFFSYYKSLWFVAASYVSLGLIFVLTLTGQYKLKKSKYYIPLGIYLFFVILSFVMSDYDIVAWRGFVDLYQGVWVLIGYGLVVFLAMNYIQNEKHVKTLVGSYIFVGLVTSFIGLGQYFGHDIFQTEFGKYLILPENLHPLVESLKFNFGEKTIYATLYNTNFVGSFAVILMCLAAALFMYSKGVVQVVLSGIFLALMSFVWIGSNSRAGWLGFAVGIIFIILLFRKSFKRNVVKIVSLAVLGMVVLVAFNLVTDGRIVKEIKSVNLFDELSRLEDKASSQVRIEDIRLGKNTAKITTEGEDLKIIVKGSDMVFEDGDGNPLEASLNDNVITFSDEAYSSFRVYLNDVGGKYTLKMYGKKFDLYLIEEGFRILGSGGVLGVYSEPERLEFMDGYEEFASSRGYIWSRSVPMMKETILIGHGPDTFAMEFPQKDYVGKLYAFNKVSTIVDKPHNMYLQIGINTGVISLLALLSLFFMYFIDSMRLYWKRDIVTFLDHIGIGCVTGMIAYLGAGFFNDQVISVAPIFYVMVGLGIAVNRLVRKQSAESQE